MLRRVANKQSKSAITETDFCSGVGGDQKQSQKGSDYRAYMRQVAQNHNSKWWRIQNMCVWPVNTQL